LAARHTAPRRGAGAFPVALAVVVLGILVASLSATVRERVEETVDVLQGRGLQDESTLSTRTRLELARNGLEVARQNWLFGTGWAGYADAYRAVALERHPDQPALPGSHSDNPHNEYLLQLGAGGLPSLLLFLAWLAWPMWRALREDPRAIHGRGSAGRSRSLSPWRAVQFGAAGLRRSAFLFGAHGLAAGAPDRPELAVRSVLVVVTRQIGDVLLTTPLIREVRRRWPQARVDVLGFAGTLGMLRGNPDLHELIEVPPRPGARGTLRWRAASGGVTTWRWWRTRRPRPPDRMGGGARTRGRAAAAQRQQLVEGTAAAACGAQSRRPGQRPCRRREAGAAGSRGRLPKRRAPAGRSRRAPRCPRPCKASCARLRGRARALDVAVQAVAAGALPRTGGLAGTGRPPGRADGRPGAADRAAVAALAGSAIDAGLLDFNQVAALLRGAALYIGPDTSVSHLAAACGIPVLAIFGRPTRSAGRPGRRASSRCASSGGHSRRPVGQVTLLQSDLHCVPCGKAGCEDHRMSRADCLPAIAPARVAAKALEILSPVDRAE
jgi:heptosyltransferase-3